MMSKSKKVVALKEVKKDAKKIKVTNSMFEVFNKEMRSSHSLAIAKLKLSLSGKAAYDLTKYITRLMESLDAKTYFNRKAEILKAFQDAQEKLPKEKRKPPLLENIPEWKKLIEMETELEVEKYQIDMAKIPEDMTNYLLTMIEREKASTQPNIQRIQMIEQQIEQEKQRLLNGFDIDILNLYFDLI